MFFLFSPIMVKNKNFLPKGPWLIWPRGKYYLPLGQISHGPFGKKTKYATGLHQCTCPELCMGGVLESEGLRHMMFIRKERGGLSTSSKSGTTFIS